MFNFLKLSAIPIAKNKFEAIEEWINGSVQFQSPQVLKDASVINWRYTDGYNAQVTLGGNRTLNITDMRPGACGTIEIIQGSGGNKTLTLPTNFTNKVAGAGSGALTLSTTELKIDVASFYYNGSYILWTLSTDFT
jgi:hypothetical protein